MRSARPGRVVALTTLFVASGMGTPETGAGQAASPAVAASAPRLGDHNIYVGTYRQAIAIVDESTGQVAGEIPLTLGIPRSMVVTPDRERFYVLDTFYETIEIVDIASQRAVRKFTLSTPREKVRIWSYNVDPRERYVILLTKRYTQRSDRYEVGPPTLLRYDLSTGTVTDTIAWPNGEERDRAQILFSPNGDLMYFFADDILVYETEGFTEVDRWDYSTALDDGMGPFSFGFSAQANDSPGHYTNLFRFSDPVHNRRFMGVARVDLADRNVEVFPLGPDESVSFVVAPGGRKAYGIHSEVGNYQFWTFDLENHRVEGSARFAGRPRMSLAVSSSGEVLYVFNAGNTIDLYDASGYEYLRTIDLGADTTTPLFVIPKP